MANKLKGKARKTEIKALLHFCPLSCFQKYPTTSIHVALPISPRPNDSFANLHKILGLYTGLIKIFCFSSEETHLTTQEEKQEACKKGTVCLHNSIFIIIFACNNHKVSVHTHFLIKFA
ncbi:MAG: hypothetical protein PUH24_09270 [Prevotellaceae bacterium]|nr:hypothetical protein [Prevotella sp.]MDD7258436.1 hypothetical protein [Prevotellaceae bacterium]MDY6130030.1 hypothetical protein [Prevotella sp.]